LRGETYHRRRADATGPRKRLLLWRNHGLDLPPLCVPACRSGPFRPALWGHGSEKGSSV